MKSSVNTLILKTYLNCSFNITDFQIEPESQEYEASRFNLNSYKIVYRTAKITPKKKGQFVTFWKRNTVGITVPFSENDPFDFYVITVQKETKLGQFIIPKSILIKKGIMSTEKKDGKRGFRVYSSWDIPTNKQAIKTQEWQLNYFVEINESIDLKRLKNLLSHQ